MSCLSNCIRSILATSHQLSAFIRLCSTFTPNALIYLGISVVGPQTITSAPNCFRHNMFDSATRECSISPTITTFFPATSPYFSRIEKASSKAWVGCSCAPSPAFTIWAFTCFDKNVAAPAYGWRITTISTFIANMLLTVSISVSPLLTDDDEAAKFTTSADRRFSASSNDNRVRVEFSKNILAMVTSRSDGTFRICG